MLSKNSILFFGLFFLSNLLLGQVSANTKPPIKYRLLLTTVELQDVNTDEVVISLNAFNTGRNPINLYDFNSVPEEMEIKFEESFYRSNLSEMEDEIISSLINRNITITNGKILRNLKFNLQADEDLYKELTKTQKRYSRTYSPKDKKKAPKLKYKTNTKKEIKELPELFAKKKKKSKKTEALNNKKENEIATSTTKVNIPATSKKPKSKDKVELIENKKDDQKIEKTVDTVVQNTRDIKPDKNKKLSVLSKQKEKKSESEKAKKDSYKIEQASQKEEEKAILESLGVGKKKDNVAFDTRAGVEGSKQSYAQKSVCPDMTFKSVKVLKKTKNYITIEYTLENIGKGPALIGNGSKNNVSIAIRAFLSSSENLTRGSLPLGGGFVTYKNGKKEHLDVNESLTGTLKMDIKKMTRFTPFVILNFDPFNALEECNKTNNYGNVRADN